MFLKLIKFESWYQSRQRAFLLFSLLFTLFGYQIGGQGFAPAKVLFNSGYQLNYYTGIFTLGSVFIIMFFCISAILRDTQHQMDQIIYSTALQKQHFFISRFLGAFVFSVLAFSTFLVGFAVGTLSPTLDPSRLAPFNMLDYLWTFCVVVLPNIFICTALVFSIAILSKNRVATYTSAVMIYVLYWVCSIFLNSPLLANATPASPESLTIAALSDPFGLSAFFEQTQYWTPHEKNTRLISLTGNYLWNRLIWTSLALTVLTFTYTRFSFRKLKQRAKKNAENKAEAVAQINYTPRDTAQNMKSQVQTFLSLLRQDIKSTFRSLPFIGVMLVWMVIIVIEIYTRIAQGGSYDDSWYPMTHLLIEQLLDPLVPMALILIVFYSAELVWKARSAHFHPVIDSAPVSNSVFFLSKLTAVVLLPLLLIAAGIIVAVVFQLGQTPIRWKLYFSIFYFQGVSLMFYAILATCIQTVVSNKYVGMVLTLLVVMFLGSPLSVYIGIEHPLLRLGATPNVPYTPMLGFGGEAASFHWYAMYWMLLAVVMILWVVRFWKRGILSTFSFRFKRSLMTWNKKARWAFFSTLLLFFAVGSVIFYHTNVLTEYVSSGERLDRAEQYERKFKKYDVLEELYPVALKTEVALFPKQQKYEVIADYRLKNKGDVIVDKVFISPRQPLDSIWLENATLIEHDATFKTYLFALDPPLKPGETLQFRYTITGGTVGFDYQNAVVNNGSYLMHSNFEPSLGYRNSFEIRDANERKLRSLPPRVEEKVGDAHLYQDESNKIGRVPFETVVSTNADQTAIAPGDLIKKWSEGDRNYYHFKAPKKIAPLLGYFSAEYSTERKQHRNIWIEQYFHSAHSMNIAASTEAVQQTLDYCIDNFGEYPFDHLRIAEIPGPRGFGGMAMPGTISMVEENFYLLDQRDPEVFDLVGKRTIHEVAHQWWGHILTPKQTEGSAIMIEGLAKYTEAVIMEKHHGKGALHTLSKYSNNRYFIGRAYTSETEPPLYLEDGQGYLHYGKNYTVMLALKELIGEEKINSVLRDLIEKQKDAERLETISLDFLEGLYKVTPSEYHQLIDDWFKRVITYDLSVVDASYEKMSNGQYKVTASFKTKRWETGENGEIKPISINEPIPIGIFSKHPKRIKPDKKGMLYLKPHQINEDTFELEFIINQKPTYITIDPYGTRSDKNLIDNLKLLE